MDKALRKTILDILTHTNDMTIATVRPDGCPQATTVSYVSEGLTIYFVTGTHAQKAQNLAKCDKVSLTVDRPYTDWNEILGLSLGGTATPLTDEDEIEKVEKLMAKKFPQSRRLLHARRRHRLLQGHAQGDRVLDYSKGFGHTDTVTL